VEPDVRALLMIGHNPGFEDLAKALIGHGDRYAFARLAKKYPTAGLAVIDFPGDAWSAVANHAGRLDRFVTPKTLGADEDD
jgi:phosphohistidine phosphatase